MIFGAPETVPGREARDERVQMVAILCQPAVHRRDEVHHVRIALERHVLRHPHRTELADAPEIVAPEVDQHDVLGSLLLVALELLRHAKVFVFVGAARPRAGNRVRLGASPFDADEHLRRRADDREAVHPHEIHVRRRIDVTQGAVDRERVGGDLCLEALRQDRLIDVAGGDVLLDGAHARFEDLARLVGREFGSGCVSAADGCDRLRSSSRSRNWILAHAN